MRFAMILGKFASAVILPVLILGFVISERTGFWDRYFGLNHVLEFATRLETSYAEGVDRQLRPGQPGWDAMLTLIRRYSPAQLPTNREPKLLGRSVAVTSAKLDLDGGKFAEWTAPSTPIILIYIEWPGQIVTPADYRVVGTIGDIRTWVDKRRSDFHFLTRDILLSMAGIVVGVILWLSEHRPKKV
jgi:hypothetical protein